MAPQLEDVGSGYDTYQQLFVTDDSFREALYNSELLEPAVDLTSPAYDMPGDSSPAVHAMDDVQKFRPTEARGGPPRARRGPAEGPQN